MRRFIKQRLAWWSALATLAVSPPAAAKVFLTPEEALGLAFPGCSIERRTVYLTAAQQEQASKLAGQQVTQALAYPYSATCDGKPGGSAYFDVHRVRTLPQTIMVVVATDGSVRRVEVLAFNEPEDYLPKAAWYGQFAGKKLSGELQLKKAIRPIAGATLTARATTEAVRRVLAIHEAIGAGGSVRP